MPLHIMNIFQEDTFVLKLDTQGYMGVHLNDRAAVESKSISCSSGEQLGYMSPPSYAPFSLSETASIRTTFLGRGYPR